MKKVKYTAISYCSSQKSALTGQPGFGVRSFSDGFDTSICDYLSADRDINDIPQTKVYGYELPDDRKLLFADIEVDANVVKKYPISFTYKPLVTPAKTYYVFARTVYIGIDYGYFCGIENAKRVGANYFSHILLFDETPPQEIFDILIENNRYNNDVFLPVDYKCSPDNQELTKLLTGEPMSLSSKDFCIDKTIKDVNITDNDIDLIIAILQLHINRKLGNYDKRIIVKASHTQAAQLIGCAKTQLPSFLVGDISFQTNYNKSGTPKDIDIVFVNEHYFGGDLYETDHICIDLLTNNHIGLNDNYLYQKLREMVVSKDIESLLLLLEYISCVDITENTDYEFIYKLFVLAKSQIEVSVTDVTFDFIDKLNKFKLPKSDHYIVWAKINSTINNAISSRDNLLIKTALQLINHVGASNEIIISDESKVLFTKQVFDIPMNFGEIISNKNVDITINLIAKGEIKNSERLFISLQTLNDAAVWEKYIKLCFPASEIEKRCSLIINEVLNANFTEDEQCKVINLLYKKNVHPVIEYILENPKNIPALKTTVEQICSNKIELIVKFILAANNDVEILSVFRPISNRYYGAKISNNGSYIKGTCEYIDFANKISISIANKIGASEMIDKFTIELQKDPEVRSKDVIAKILESGLDISNQSRKTLEDIHNIICNKTPDCVDKQLMEVAYLLGKKELLYPMFELWIKNRVSIDDLKNYIKSSESIQRDPQFIKHMILSIWKSRVSIVRDNKEDYVLLIIDNVKWSQKEYKDFLHNCDDQKLIAFLSKSSSFINKLLRKLFKF